MNNDRESTSPVVVHLGCGNSKRAGSIGLDILPCPEVDCVCDLAASHWPLRRGSVDRLLAFHVVEHIPNLTAFMSKTYASLKPNGILEIEAPHGATLRYLGDPTHCTPITCSTFRYFEPDYPYNYYTDARFLVERMDLILPPSLLQKMWKFLWKKRMWSMERLLVFLCIDFSLHAVLRKVPSDPDAAIETDSPGTSP